MELLAQPTLVLKKEMFTNSARTSAPRSTAIKQRMAKKKSVMLVLNVTWTWPVDLLLLLVNCLARSQLPQLMTYISMSSQLE
jgi:hypothetical protein